MYRAWLSNDWTEDFKASLIRCKGVEVIRGVGKIPSIAIIECLDSKLGTLLRASGEAFVARLFSSLSSDVAAEEVGWCVVPVT